MKITTVYRCLQCLCVCINRKSIPLKNNGLVFVATSYKGTVPGSMWVYAQEKPFRRRRDLVQRLVPGHHRMVLLYSLCGLRVHHMLWTKVHDHQL